MWLVATIFISTCLESGICVCARAHALTDMQTSISHLPKDNN